MKNLLLFSFCILISVACSKQNAYTGYNGNFLGQGFVCDTFVIASPDTKTSYSIADGVSWETDDIIYYYSGPSEEGLEKRSFTIQSSGSSAQIQLTRPESDTYYVLIHNGTENALMKQYGTTMAFSGINPGQDGTFESANISASYFAASSQEAISMHNITTPLEFSIARTDVKKVSFKGNNKEYVNGRLQVNLTTNPYTVSRYSNYPNAKGNANYTDSILFTSSPSVNPYYLNIMPQTFSKGFTISYYGAEDYLIGTTATSSSVDFSAGKMKYISGVNVKYSTEGMAKWHEWEVSTTEANKFYQKFDIDNNISIDAGTNIQQGYYFVDDSKRHYWRLYEARGPEFKISAKNDYKIKSITFTYTNKNYGVIKSGTTSMSSDTPLNFDTPVAEATLSVGHSSGASKGSVAITHIKVSYIKATN